MTGGVQYLPGSYRQLGSSGPCTYIVAVGEWAGVAYVSTEIRVPDSLSAKATG
jgi:hypothetical protein